MGKRAPSLSSLGVESEEELVRRALAAWYRGAGTDAPSSDSAVEAHGGHWYVVLRGGSGAPGAPLAVYRLKNDGLLRRLRRWPASIAG